MIGDLPMPKQAKVVRSVVEAAGPATAAKDISGGSGTPAALRAFRETFYTCLRRRADALFELADAILTVGSVHSPPHLSLSPVHRRGWGSLYAALSKGSIDVEALRELLAGHPLAEDGSGGFPRVYAVDQSPWPRCDAEASPERGYYCHPSGKGPGM
jgi:hypothetical protein